MNTNEEKGPKPVHVIHYQPWRISIWRHTSKQTGKDFHSVSIQRSYKTPNGEWKYSQSATKQNIKNVIDALQDAEEWLEINEKND